VKNNLQTVVVALIFGGLLGAGICFGILKYREAGAGVSSRTADGETDADGEKDAERNPEALGRIEPAGGVIDVSGPVGVRITSIEKGIEPGVKVQAGAALFHLESRELIEAQLSAVKLELAQAKSAHEAQKLAAQAAVKAAEIELKQAELAEEGDLKLHQAKIDVAEAARKTVKTDHEILSELHKNGQEPESVGFVNEQQVAQQAALLEKANAEVAYAQAVYDKAKATLEVARLAAQAQLDAATKKLEAIEKNTAVKLLEQKKETTEAELDRATICAPSGGTILKIFMQEGEAIGPRPVLKMANLEEMVVVAEVYETDIKLIRGKDPKKVEKKHVTISSKAFDLSKDDSKTGLKGTVRSIKSIGNLVSTPELKHLDPFARTDRHSVEVVVAIDEDDVEKAASFVNLQVIVKFSSQDTSDENAPGVAQSGS